MRDPLDLDREIRRALFRNEALDDLAPRPKNTHPARHWPHVVLMERAAYLKEMARFGDGSAEEAVREFPGHSARLFFRSRTAEAELHARHAALFVVLAGSATLVTGGRLVSAHEIAPDESRGDTIEGGRSQQLHPGDIAHVPAGIPYQFQLCGEQTLSGFVLAIEEPAPEKKP